MPTPRTPSWRVHRQPSPRQDGQQRWDRAYLRVLQWTQVVPTSPPQARIRPLPGPEQEEASHDGRPVRARLNPAPVRHAND
jgi:hypothetical protein